MAAIVSLTVALVTLALLAAWYRQLAKKGWSVKHPEVNRIFLVFCWMEMIIMVVIVNGHSSANRFKLIVVAYFIAACCNFYCIFRAVEPNSEFIVTRRIKILLGGSLLLVAAVAITVFFV